MFFACPTSKQAWPNNADCWSPAIPAMGKDLPRIELSISASFPLEGTISGSADSSIPNIANNSSSQDAVSRLQSMVLEALVTSVLKTFPAVRFQINQESTVPKQISPAFILSDNPGTSLSNQRILLAEKYGSKTNPVFLRINDSLPSAFSCSQIAVERLHCQTIAGASGFPVAFSQTTVVSR